MSNTKKQVGSVQELIIELQKDKGAFLKYDFGELGQKDIDMVREATGFDLSGFSRTIDSYGINHVMDKHANEKTENKRGQSPVRYSDFEAIGFVAANPDTIEIAGKNRHGGDLIKYSKQMGETFFYVEEIRSGKKEVALQTLYKRK